MYTYIYIHKCTYICMYTYIYIYIHKCTNIYIYKRLLPRFGRGCDQHPCAGAYNRHLKIERRI